MRVAVTSKAFARTPALVDYLTNAFPDYKLNNASRTLTEDETVEFLADADAVILALEPMTEAVLARLPRLKAIAKCGVGLDNVDQEACRRRNIPLLYTPGVNKESVAELALCMALSLLRNVAKTLVGRRVA